MIDIPFHPNRDRNLKRATNTTDCCIVCGKLITSKKVQWLHIWYGSYAVTEEEAQTLEVQDKKNNLCGDTGGYPIGNDCLRKHPELKEYTK